MKRLGPNVRLESTAAGPLLRYLPQPGLDDLPPLPLHPLLALALARLDRGENVDAIGADLAARLGSPFEAMREIVADANLSFSAHFKNDNGASYVDLGDLDAMTVALAVPGTVYRSRDVVFPRDRAHFPLTLQWLVTRYCNRHCVYCYAGADSGGTAKDAELTGERMRQILREAARLGTCNFMLTGGEPLLRDDIYELIAEGLALGLMPEIISKQFIPAVAVSRLAEAGMPRIYLSIDSLDPELARRMTGVRGFAEQITATIERLVAAGITVCAKAVVTADTIEDIPATAARLDALGVKFYGLVLYERNLQRHSDALVPSHESLLRLRDWSESFAAAKHGLNVSFSYDPDKRPELGPDRFVCHNGTITMLLLPDGRVSRCDKRLPGEELIVGDLRTQSVHEAWSSAAMLGSMKPPRERYAGTLCYDCEQFDVCQERGRCYYSAFLTSGTLFGPAGNCPYFEGGIAAGC